MDSVFDRAANWDVRCTTADLLAQKNDDFLFESTVDRESREAAERKRSKAEQEEAEDNAAAEAIHQEQSQGPVHTAAIEEEGTTPAAGNEGGEGVPMADATVVGEGAPPTATEGGTTTAPGGPPEETGIGDTGTTTTQLHVQVDPVVASYGQWPTFIPGYATRSTRRASGDAVPEPFDDIDEFTPDGAPESAARAAARRREFPLPIRTFAKDTEEARK